MALDMSKMRAKLDNLQGRGDGKKSNFWRPKDGEQTIRIVSQQMEIRLRTITFTIWK